MNTLPFNTYGACALGLFVFMYALVILEEKLHLKKSKPVVLGAGLLWVLVSAYASQHQASEQAIAQLRHYLLEYSELLLFLIVAMTYINTLDERGLFRQLQNQLTQRAFSYRQLFWLLCLLTFFISAIADNLTTALFMSAVAIALGKDQPRFVSGCCVALVVSANAGGAFSPFGDITTLMVWQKGILSFTEFFPLILPSFVNFVVPALFIHYTMPKGRPQPLGDAFSVLPGCYGVLALFLFTILLCVLGHHFYHLPPALGMMTGLGLLQFYSYFLKRQSKKVQVDTFKAVERCEWDTLLFFYGIVLSVGALAYFGYLSLLSQFLYQDLGNALSLPPSFHPTLANTLLGLLSAIIDNIPVMFALLSMEPSLSQGQWLLATLTIGVGGSVLSIGSAAGVALMGQAPGIYTFSSHLRWVGVILLGYFASIATHLLLNQTLF